MPFLHFVQRIFMKYIQKNKKALKLFEKNKTDKAIELINKLLHKNEDIGLNSLILYEIYCFIHNMQNAVSILEKTVSSNNLKDLSEKFEIHMILGSLYHNKSAYKKAYFYYKNALNIKKQDEKVLTQLGLLYFDINNITNAGKIFTLLNQKDSTNLYYKTLLALYFCESGDYEKCSNLVQEVINKKQNYYPAYYVSGYSKFIAGKYQEALEEFDKAKHGKEFRFKALYYAGKSKMNTDNFKHGIDYFSEALPLIEFENKLTLDLRYSLALCYEDDKNFHSALEQLRIIHKVNPEYKDIAEKLISDNYKNIGSNYLIGYNTFSAEEFVLFGKKLLASFNLKTLNHKLINDNNTLIFTVKVNKIGIIHKLLKNVINYHKLDTLLVVFLRSLPVKEEFLETLLLKTEIKYSKCIVFSSGPVSPLALSYAHKHDIEVITPTHLSKIVHGFSLRNK